MTTTSTSTSTLYATQNDLLLHNLLKFYNEGDNMTQMLSIIDGQSKISLRIIDWFVTNYAKKNYTVYNTAFSSPSRRFKVYDDYKLKLKAYSKKRFDPFCRWDRISVPYKDGNFIQTTLGQLNFFKWALENEVIEYIRSNYTDIEEDMNARNNVTRRKNVSSDSDTYTVGLSDSKTRKKREELSVSATKSIKKEKVEIVLSFN
jgi:hypothetical protein